MSGEELELLAIEAIKNNTSKSEFVCDKAVGVSLAPNYYFDIKNEKRILHPGETIYSVFEKVVLYWYKDIDTYKIINDYYFFLKKGVYINNKPEKVVFCNHIYDRKKDGEKSDTNPAPFGYEDTRLVAFACFYADKEDEKPYISFELNNEQAKYVARQILN